MLAGFVPPPDLKPSEWAERSVYIPIGNAVPGLIRFDNAPYQREPLDMTADPTCSRITLMWGAQVGKTMLALCAQAYRIAQNPASQIMMQPSQGDLQTWLETKFNPMVDANDELQALIARPRGRDGVNNQRMKSYPGGFMMFSWAGSPKTMRGRSAPFIVCDEVDGYSRVADGSPVELLWQRAATFGDQRKLLEISTPLIKHESWIEAAFDQGDRRRFHVPCPHCGERQHLRWANVIWDKAEDGEHLPDSARYMCSECGAAWSDAERVSAVRLGEWVAERPFRGHASYHLNELYSCFRRLGDIVRSFLSKKAANDMQSFVNISLAETWEETGERISDGDVLRLAEPYGADDLPEEVLFATAGVDTQDDRLEVEVVGWDAEERSWGIGYHVLYGDPAQPHVWAELDALLRDTYSTASGRVVRVQAACIDSGGHHAEAVQRFCRDRFRRRVYAIKGMGGPGRPIWPPRASKSASKDMVFLVGVDTAKDTVYARWRIDDGPGQCRIPADPATGYDETWAAQVTAEQRVTRYRHGQPYTQWEKPNGKRNEALDCRVYATAALKSLPRSLRGATTDPAAARTIRAQPATLAPDDWIGAGDGWI